MIYVSIILMAIDQSSMKLGPAFKGEKNQIKIKNDKNLTFNGIDIPNKINN